MSTLKLPELPELEFSEENHIYRLRGAEIPSVSAVMGPLSRHEYGGVDERTLNNAAARGTTVHNAIENWIKYGIEDIDPDLRGYMDGFLEWWGQMKPELIGSEIRTYHQLMGYGGTVDLLAKIGDEIALVDFKTTSRLIDKNCRVQLEAYAQALASHGIRIDKKLILHLGKDGKWKAPEFPARDGEAWSVFGSLKCIYDYLRK